ncbi:MAG: hypothetical protein J6K18_00005 [Bacilli bacterium]|nr:hypothetical protein [Bacilli bacterium]
MRYPSNSNSLGHYFKFAGILFWILGVILGLYDLIDNIIDKANIKQYLGVIFIFGFLELIGTACYFKGKDLIEKSK